MDVPEFLNSLTNPLKDKNVIKKIISAYGYGNYYTNIVKTNIEDKETGMRDNVESDRLYSRVFNSWKRNIIDMSKETYDEKFKNGKLDDDFPYMRQLLKTVPDLSTRQEVLDFLYKQKDEKFSKALEKYNPFDRPTTSWSYFANRYVDNYQSSTYYPRHRLYFNIDSSYVHRVANLFLDYCAKYNLIYEFKFDEYADRADSFVVYCSDDNLMLFLKIFELMRKEYPDIVPHFHKPPLFSGVYNGWLGYGEEWSKAESSYNDDRCNIIESELDLSLDEWQKNACFYRVNIGNKSFSIIDYIVLKVYNQKLAYLKKEYDFKKRLGCLEAKHNLLLMNNVDDRKKLFDTVKKFVYLNASAIYGTGNVSLSSLELDVVPGEKYFLYYSDVKREVIDLFKSNIINDSKKLSEIQTKITDALDRKGISGKMVFSNETNEELVSYSSDIEEKRKVVASRRADNVKIYGECFHLLDQMRAIVKNNSKEAAMNLILPLRDKMRALINVLTKMQLSRFSSGSDDFDERMQTYIAYMIKCIKNCDITSYDYFANILMSYESVERHLK